MPIHSTAKTGLALAATLLAASAAAAPAARLEPIAAPRPASPAPAPALVPSLMPPLKTALLSGVSPIAMAPNVPSAPAELPRLPGQALFTIAELASHSPVAFKAYERLSDRWELSARERHAVIGADARTYAVWKAGPKPLLTSQSLERVSLTLTIYRRLMAIYGDPQLQNRWIKYPNTQFEGRPPLSLMASPDIKDIYRVRDYLLFDAGGGWF